MANIFDVSKYILRKSGAMSLIKLERLCYYSQAWMLAWDDIEMFNEEFYSIESGVFSEDIHKRYEKYMFKINYTQMHGDIKKITQREKVIIDSVLNFYGKKDSQWLRELITKEFPWKNSYKKNEQSLISKNDMKKYYASLD